MTCDCRVIQIEAAVVGELPVLYALCSDGSLWRTTWSTDSGWMEIPPPPAKAKPEDAAL